MTYVQRGRSVLVPRGRTPPARPSSKESPITVTGGSPNALTRHMRLRSATALVIANMIGAGIFTTTGFQAADLRHPLLIFVLWGVGGTLALLGALCYAELGAMMPRAGAEYVYLRETYGPAFGFMSAFVSLVAGFSAPIAAATKSFVIYVSHFFPFLAEDLTLGGGRRGRRPDRCGAGLGPGCDPHASSTLGHRLQ